MPKVTRSSDNRLMHSNVLPKDCVWNDTSCFLEKEKGVLWAQWLFWCMGWFPQKQQWKLLSLRMYKFTEVESWLLRVCKTDSAFWVPMRLKEQTCKCIQESWTSCRSSTWLQWGLEVIPLWPPWAGANTQLELWQFGFDYPSTWGDQQWLTGRLPGGTAILPSPPMSQSLCTFLDGGQRETRTLTGYKSDGGSRQDRCGKAAVCVPSMQTL